MYQFVFNERADFEKVALCTSSFLVELTRIAYAYRKKSYFRKFFLDRKDPHTIGFLKVMTRGSTEEDLKYLSWYKFRIRDLRDYFVAQKKIAVSFDPTYILDSRISICPDLNIWKIEWQERDGQEYPDWYHDHFLVYVKELEDNNFGLIQEGVLTTTLKPRMETTAEVKAFLTKQNPFYF